jgi:hypothetical protein
MPFSLTKQVLRSPVKLFLLCLVLYLASRSFFVAGALMLMAIGYVRGLIRQQAKETMARAKAESDAEASRSVATPPAKQAPIATGSSGPQPQREYAKSAVILPFKTGTRN